MAYLIIEYIPYLIHSLIINLYIYTDTERSLTFLSQKMHTDKLKGCIA